MDNIPRPLVVTNSCYLDLVTLTRIKINDPELTTLSFERQFDDDDAGENIQNIQAMDPRTLESKTIDLTNKDEIFLETLSLSLRNNTFIKELYIGDQILTVNGWKTIFGVLQYNKFIKHLDIGRRTNFEFTCAQLFATMVLFNRDSCTPACFSLTHLDVDNTPMGINGMLVIIDALCANPKGSNLTYLSLNHVREENETNSEMITQLAEKYVSLLQHNTTKLKQLHLPSLNLGDDFVTILANGLKYNTQLEKLIFGNIFDRRGQGITSIGADALANVLDFNGALKELHLPNNDIGDNGATAIAGALRNNTQLKSLGLGNNGITSAGLISLVDALHHNCTLILLDISSNAIADEGATVLSGALRYNCTLKKLILCRSQITSIGAKALADAFYYNSTLLTLQLDNNSITDDGLIALGNSLRYQQTIEVLGLFRNPISLDVSWDFLKFNESLKKVYFDHHDTPLVQSILDYNDTLCYIRSESANVQQLLRQNIEGQRSATKKGLRRKQDVYSWLLKISGL